MDHGTDKSWTKTETLHVPGIKVDKKDMERHWGTGHGDELQFFFKWEGVKGVSDDNNEADMEMKEIFLDYFTNFATFGSPNNPSFPKHRLNWPTFKWNSTASNIFVFNPNPRLVPELLTSKSHEFWKNLRKIH
ncbi:unnamed protein product, partial [Notodromas monacha]